MQEKPHALPEALEKDARILQWRRLQGVDREPDSLVYGWQLRLDRHTTKEERFWLGTNGWKFSGGAWYRSHRLADEGPIDPRMKPEWCRCIGQRCFGHCMA